MQLRFAAIFVLLGATALAGCQQPKAAPSVDMTYQRGTQMLAAGSPKSAITFLSQTVAATPSQPEPVAMLALAYALDVQPELALQQVQQVVRPEKSAPGWETVAAGVAYMTQQKYPLAIASLQRGLATPESPMTPAAEQWLVLAYVLQNDYEKGFDTLKTLSANPGMKTSAMLWSVLLYSQQNQPKEASAALTQAAAGLTKDPGILGQQSNADDQLLYDSAVSAVAAGNMTVAQQTFDILRKRNPDAADTATWNALLTAAKGDWAAARNQLKDACEAGPTHGRGIANQLYSVVCATEDRPEDMVRFMVTGQRLMARTSINRPIEPAKPDNVWFSDKIKTN